MQNLYENAVNIGDRNVGRREHSLSSKFMLMTHTQTDAKLYWLYWVNNLLNIIHKYLQIHLLLKGKHAASPLET
jgi:hypothetical protein